MGRATCSRIALVAVASLAVSGCGGVKVPSVEPATSLPTTTAVATTASAPSASVTTARPASTATATTRTGQTSVSGVTQTSAPAPGAPALQIRKGGNGRPFVALSFDAGADKGFTQQILDLLKSEKIIVSFGMTGLWAEQNPELFKRIVADGHHLINHTYGHKSWTGVSSSTQPLNRDQRIQELDKADAVFMRLAGVSSKPWFRPPFGDVDNEMDKLLGQMGYRYNALWTVDSLGWNKKTASQIAEICRKGYVPGGILLFHVGEQSQDANALPQIIREIRAAGLTPGSLLDVI